MKGDAEILKVLQEVLSAELTAINQYFIHARMLRNWRYMRLAEHTEKESIGEMKHAQEAIDRILYFEGVPNMQKYMKINVGKTVPDMMRVDHASSSTRSKRLNHGIVLAADKKDNGSRALVREDPDLGGGAHRLARGPDPADQGPRYRELLAQQIEP